MYINTDIISLGWEREEKKNRWMGGWSGGRNRQAVTTEERGEGEKKSYADIFINNFPLADSWMGKIFG